jgi:hypothetical protein
MREEWSVGVTIYVPELITYPELILSSKVISFELISQPFVFKLLKYTYSIVKKRYVNFDEEILSEKYLGFLTTPKTTGFASINSIPGFLERRILNRLPPDLGEIMDSMYILCLSTLKRCRLLYVA